MFVLHIVCACTYIYVYMHTCINNSEYWSQISCKPSISNFFALIYLILMTPCAIGTSNIYTAQMRKQMRDWCKGSVVHVWKLGSKSYTLTWIYEHVFIWPRPFIATLGTQEASYYSLTHWNDCNNCQNNFLKKLFQTESTWKMQSKPVHRGVNKLY